MRQISSIKKVGGGGPPAEGSEGHGLVLGERGRAEGRHRNPPDELDDPHGPPPHGRDPVGGPGTEGEPVGAAPPDDDAVDRVLQPPHPHVDLHLHFGSSGFGFGSEIDLDQLGRGGRAVGFGSAGGEEEGWDLY